MRGGAAAGRAEASGAVTSGTFALTGGKASAGGVAAALDVAAGVDAVRLQAARPVLKTAPIARADTVACKECFMIAIRFRCGS